MTITLANLNRFLHFLKYHFNREETLHATVVKYTTHLNCVRTLLRKLQLQHFSVKNAIILCSLTFTAKENRKKSSNLQCCPFDIVILGVPIIRNVQNVRLQPQHRPTDDASTRRWRGSQQANNDIYYVISNTFFK